MSTPTLQRNLAFVLKSNLVLDKSGMSAGEEKCKLLFLCGDINDCDLPWDVTQDDW